MGRFSKFLDLDNLKSMGLSFAPGFEKIRPQMQNPYVMSRFSDLLFSKMQISQPKMDRFSKFLVLDDSKFDELSFASGFRQIGSEIPKFYL